MIEAIINEQLKKIPIYWPLERFIAINPLWDLVDNDIYSTSILMSEATNLKCTLECEEYLKFYQDKLISKANLTEAINWFWSRHVTELNQAEFELLQEVLVNFMTEEKYVTHFSQAKKTRADILISQQIAQHFYDEPVMSIKNECINLILAFINPNQFSKTLLDQKKSFFNFCKDLLRTKNRRWREILPIYSIEPMTFIEFALNKLNVPESKFADYVLQILWQLKGWNAFIKWQMSHPNNPWFEKHIAIDEIIALWLAYELHWLNNNKRKLKNFKAFASVVNTREKDLFSEAWQIYLEDTFHALLLSKRYQKFKTLFANFEFRQQHLELIWQRAYELNYQNILYQSLTRGQLSDQQQKPYKEQHNGPIMIQWFFCIDTRSEGMRRYIETIKGNETFGFAGFFGFALNLLNKNKGSIDHQCPAIIQPDLKVEISTSRPSNLSQVTNKLQTSIERCKQSLLNAFVLYEISGIWLPFYLLAKLYLIQFSTKLTYKLKNNSDKTPTTKMLNTRAIDYQKLAVQAEQVLRTMSLTKNFADLVVLSGHKAATQNNPFQASLDCGACGGNSGAINAIFACEIFNNSKVREYLKAKNINIPDSTLFVAACHNTTTDEIEWHYGSELLTKQQINLIEHAKKIAIQAGSKLRQERLTNLPFDKNVFTRSQHIAELVPEWGLLNNKAMVIGPRSLTAKLNLERQVFLHSYDPQQDESGEILETILMGPLLVAHWINMQYYFSTVAPEVYCAGNKAIHNVVSGIGVMEGNQSDLKIGLPEQSLFYQGQRLHQPRRLFVIIHARHNVVETIIQNNEKLKALVNGDWLFIKTLEPEIAKEQ